MAAPVKVGLVSWAKPIFEGWWSYWFLYGGRGSGKTQNIAMGLAIRGAQVRLRVVCFRAVQNNVDESVRQELVDAIYRAGLQSVYDIKEKHIEHKWTGTRFTFRGMQKPGSLRGLAGVDCVWIDEAQDVSAKALRSLIPTIRKETAQLIFTFNPMTPDDAVWKLRQLFQGDEKTIIMEKNWRDNPWFPTKLELDRVRDLQRDPMEYQHIWEGKFWQRSDSIIFAGCCEFGLEFEPPPPWECRYYYGADFGYADDPSTLIRSWIADDCLWIDYAEFAWHLDLDNLHTLYERVPGAREWPIMADSARPDIISLLRRRGFNIAGAEKGKDSIEAGIAFMRSFSKIKVHKRCNHLQDEFMKYSWKIDKDTEQVLPVIVDKFNHGIDSCIAKGELVSTDVGLIPVENIKVGDKVLTRGGWKRVYASRLTRENAEIMTVRAGHLSLSATPCHRVWTENKGWIRMDALRYGDMLLIDEGYAGCLKNVSNTPVANGGFTLTPKTKAHAFTTGAPRPKGAEVTTCTVKSGRTPMAQFLKATRSIISMGTLSIIPLKTWSASPPKSITTSTLRTMPFFAPGSIMRESLRASGMPLLKGMSSIRSWGKCLGKIFSRSRVSVSNAERTSYPRSTAEMTSAQTHASPLGEEILGLMTKPESVSAAALNSRSINIPTRRLVPVPVQELCGAGHADVYDLSVEDCPEFVASGILVHNCRYALTPLMRAQGAYIMSDEEWNEPDDDFF